MYTARPAKQSWLKMLKHFRGNFLRVLARAKAARSHGWKTTTTGGGERRLPFHRAECFKQNKGVISSSPVLDAGTITHTWLTTSNQTRQKKNLHPPLPPPPPPPAPPPPPPPLAF